MQHPLFPGPRVRRTIDISKVFGTQAHTRLGVIDEWFDCRILCDEVIIPAKASVAQPIFLFLDSIS